MERVQGVVYDAIANLASEGQPKISFWLSAANMSLELREIVSPVSPVTLSLVGRAGNSDSRYWTGHMSDLELLSKMSRVMHGEVKDSSKLHFGCLPLT